MVERAKESKAVQKVRRKLEKIIETETKSITLDSLREMSRNIQKWITRHQDQRINLQEKNIKMFDENQSPAQVKSKFVQQLLSQLQDDFKKPGTSPLLKDRVKQSKPPISEQDL
ncbi:hypothetical protein [Estrella lausannensis]|uniref:Uncharacterized protein n=1 Tax=Estrella lausannensis TaxID=483423 RepID=A0A0H5DRU0_9BACT|nr:hypothetical protein [Estrella lausannensis]CRX38439.1 Conserved hypothetical protein [Estrella lausannensis]